MQLRLVIGDTRPEIRSAWSDVFGDIQTVTVLDADVRALRSLPEIDAELLPGLLVHERYGGKSIPGRSQVLSTHGERNMPPWVVTTPAFSAHLEEVLRPDGTLETVVVPDERYSPAEEAYIIFREAFKAVREFNEGGQEPKISSLAVNLELVAFPVGDPRAEAEAARKAYLEQVQEAGAQ